VPNIEGLLLLLRALPQARTSSARIRIVGGPNRIGHLLAKEFSNVDYLGTLPDEDLKREAGTWSCFVNPVFCHPRGCSTKLATAIGWQIPIVTTTAGHRGYVWDRGRLAVANNPQVFCDLALSMMDMGRAQANRIEVSHVARSSPTVVNVGQKIARLLGTENSETFSREQVNVPLAAEC
jgi:hypothetical protein